MSRRPTDTAITNGERKSESEAGKTASEAANGSGDRTRTEHRLGSLGEREIQRALDTVERAEQFYDNAMQDHLTDRMRSFVQDRFFGVLGGTDEQGSPVVVPRYGNAGFVHVRDESQVVWAETSVDRDRPALDGEDATLTFVDFWDTTVGLHVNGRARRVDSVEGTPANRPGAIDHWVVLDVAEAYIHCAKHIPSLELAAKSPPSSAAVPDEPAGGELTEEVRSFVGDQILAYLGTVDSHGETDVSPRLGPRGFVQRLDESRVAWPEFRGNGVHASLGNVVETGSATLSFVDWWASGGTVQLTGTATVQESVAGATDLTESDRTKTWVVLDVEQVRAERSFLPSAVVEEYDPPWGTDDEELKKAGYFTDRQAGESEL